MTLSNDAQNCPDYSHSCASVQLPARTLHTHDEHNKPKTSAFHSDFSPKASVCELCPPEVGFELPKSFAEEQRRARDVLAKIDDNENPSDYLSKWVNKHKMQRFDAYAINPSARVET